MEVNGVRAASILIVDDEEANVDLLESFLADEGYENITSTREPRQALSLFTAVKPDLVLLDLHMPHLDGFEVMRQLSRAIPLDDFVPILVLTADITAEAKQRALSEGAKDFLTKPLDAVEVVLRIRNLLETRLLYLEQRAARDRAEAGHLRAEFLAEASRILGSSFDSRTTLAVIAERALPTIADFCLVELTDGEGRFCRTAMTHVDPEIQARLEKIGEGTMTSERGGESGEPLPSGALPAKPILIPELQDGQLAGIMEDPDASEIWSVVNPRSLLRVPFVTCSGRTVGALTLATATPNRTLGEDDLALAEEVAVRAAFAVENALLYDEAQRATRSRDELLAVVAHDLRNPLNTITMVTALLRETVGGETQRKHLEIVERSAGRMDGLIQDLLEVARLESGKLSMEMLPQEIGPLLGEAAAILGPLATARSIDLQVETAPDLPEVEMDAGRILQVISNLVGNAIKFTPEQGNIRIRCERVDDRVRLAIADTGHGIAPEQIPHVFRRFWQASDADLRGVGLGLSIARGIVEAHGGTIWVESTLGEGTTFYFTLPAFEVAEEPQPAAATRLGLAGAPTAQPLIATRKKG